MQYNYFQLKYRRGITVMLLVVTIAILFILVSLILGTAAYRYLGVPIGDWPVIENWISDGVDFWRNTVSPAQPLIPSDKGEQGYLMRRFEFLQKPKGRHIFVASINQGGGWCEIEAEQSPSRIRKKIFSYDPDLGFTPVVNLFQESGCDRELLPQMFNGRIYYLQSTSTLRWVFLSDGSTGIVTIPGAESLDSMPYLDDYWVSKDNKQVFYFLKQVRPGPDYEIYPSQLRVVDTETGRDLLLLDLEEKIPHTYAAGLGINGLSPDGKNLLLSRGAGDGPWSWASWYALSLDTLVLTKLAQEDCFYYEDDLTEIKEPCTMEYLDRTAYEAYFVDNSNLNQYDQCYQSLPEDIAVKKDILEKSVCKNGASASPRIYCNVELLRCLDK